MALKQAGISDPLKEFGTLFTRAAILALPKGGDGDWMTSKIRLEGQNGTGRK